MLLYKKKKLKIFQVKMKGKVKMGKLVKKKEFKIRKMIRMIKIKKKYKIFF
jgi:hypothetical protein